MQAKQTRSDRLYMTTLDTGRCSQYVYIYIYLFIYLLIISYLRTYLPYRRTLPTCTNKIDTQEQTQTYTSQNPRRGGRENIQWQVLAWKLSDLMLVCLTISRLRALESFLGHLLPADGPRLPSAVVQRRGSGNCQLALQRAPLRLDGAFAVYLRCAQDALFQACLPHDRARMPPIMTPKRSWQAT